ncbi:hypothetical protein ACH434_14340 [Lysinibacillus fusiformis]|uniref:hypothetical protein n=1 Tax=Lysinibacillus fusiformis TaxID=28031 RepID=UPI0037B3D5A4
MSNLYTIQKRFDTMQNYSNHEELLIHILQVYLDSFPIKDAYLLRYSPIGFVAEGIIFLNEEGAVISEKFVRKYVASLLFIQLSLRKKLNFVRAWTI